MHDLNKIENRLSGEIVDACIKIHKNLGPGLLESVYEEVFAYELAENRSITVARQIPIAIEYEGIELQKGFIADLLVEEKVILELKSVEKLQPVHYKQLHTYLKLTNLKLGLLINFNEERVIDGIKRVVNRL